MYFYFLTRLTFFPKIHFHGHTNISLILTRTVIFPEVHYMKRSPTKPQWARFSWIFSLYTVPSQTYSESSVLSAKNRNTTSRPFQNFKKFEKILKIKKVRAIWKTKIFKKCLKHDFPEIVKILTKFTMEKFSTKHFPL